MTQTEVINKISKEAAEQLEKIVNIKTTESAELIELATDPEFVNAIKWFVRQALVIGTDHFTKNSEEIIALDMEGHEIGRYKNILEIEKVLGVKESNVHHVLAGRNHTAGGFMFIRSKDRDRVPVRKTA